jgi:hypothetical protein
MHCSRRIASLLVGLALASPSLTAQTVTSTPGTLYTTNGPINDDVLVSQMGGVSVRAYWGNTFQDYTIGSLGLGFWGVNDNRLTFSGFGTTDTFFNYWSINNKSTSNLTRLVFDGGSSRILFDRGTGNVGTPGSNIGFDAQACQTVVLICLIGDQWNSQVTYTNQVALNPNAPVGDLFRTIDITFGNGGVSSGFASDAFLRFDSDISQSAVTVTPEPSTYALMGVGLIALGVAARRRRRS